MSSRCRSAFVAVALVLASLLLCAALLETGLRLFWDGYYVKFRRDLPSGGSGFHPERGWSPVPDMQITRGDIEFTATYTHNAWGLRGAEIPPVKASDRVRLLVLGDSMTYGQGVDDDETYSAVLQRLEPRLEVINAGVSNYSGVQELLLLQDEGAALHPDIVLVGFFWNDVEGAWGSDYARYTFEDGALRFHPPDPVSPDHPAFASERRRHRERAERYDSPIMRSYSYRLLSDRLGLLRMMLQERFRQPDPERAASDDERERAWALSFALLSEMRRVSESMGARFAITAIPDQAEIEPDVKLVGATPDVFDTRERVRDFAERTGIPFIDLHPGVRRARELSREPFFFRYDRHWNARGHAAAAAVLREALDRLGWTSPKGEEGRGATQAAAARSGAARSTAPAPAP